MKISNFNISNIYQAVTSPKSAIVLLVYSITITILVRHLFKAVQSKNSTIQHLQNTHKIDKNKLEIEKMNNDLEYAGEVLKELSYQINILPMGTKKIFKKDKISLTQLILLKKLLSTNRLSVKSPKLNPAKNSNSINAFNNQKSLKKEIDLLFIKAQRTPLLNCKKIENNNIDSIGVKLIKLKIIIKCFEKTLSKNINNTIVKMTYVEQAENPSSALYSPCNY